jgi:HlyD family secretion protein
MQFVGAVPKGIRKGQTLQIRLALSDETTAIMYLKAVSISKQVVTGSLK